MLDTRQRDDSLRNNQSYVKLLDGVWSAVDLSGQIESVVLNTIVDLITKE